MMSNLNIIENFCYREGRKNPNKPICSDQKFVITIILNDMKIQRKHI